MNTWPRLVTVLIALTTAHGYLPAQQLTAPITAKVDSIFTDYTRPNTPGCALAIYRNDEIIYKKGYGLADLEHQVPITPQSVFCIGSTSKQFTAASLILLEQQKKLSLDDDIRKYLPEMPDYGHTITIRHLLHHTSGIRDYIGLMGMSGVDIDDVVTNDHVYRMIVRQKDLNFEPGTKHRYSNSGYLLAAIIVQRVSGQALPQFAQEHIFAPLGMEHTSFMHDHTELIPNRAIGHSRRGDSAYRLNVSYWEDYGPGNAHSTVEDLLKWDRNFYNPKIGGPELNSELTRRGILNNGDTIDYAQGLYYDDVHGLNTIQHAGAQAGYRAQYLRIPSEHLSVAVLCNCISSNVERLAGNVLEAVLPDKIVKEPMAGNEPVAEQATDSAAKPQATPVRVVPTILEAYTGEYEMSEQAGFIIRVERDGDHLYATGFAQERVVEARQELLPRSDSTFFPEKEPDVIFTFHRDSDMKVTRFTLYEGGNHPAERVRATPWSDQELSVYTGTYYSPELDTKYTVVADSGKLVAKHIRLAPVSLTPPRAAAPFSGDKWYLHTVTFEKGADGTAQTLVGMAGRTKIRFEREK